MVEAVGGGWWRLVRRTCLVVLALVAVVLLGLNFVPAVRVPQVQIAYSDFLTELNGGRVRDVILNGHAISGQLVDGRTFGTYVPSDLDSLVQRMTDKGVRIIATPESNDTNPLLHYLLSWLPSVLFWIVAFRVVGVRIRPAHDRAMVTRLAELEARLRKLEETNQ